MNSGGEPRMSQLKDRNVYLETDRLYQPLRNALRKSTVSETSHFPQLTNSRVGRNMRSLSPSEAETIKRSLLIPINKQLVPTRNIHKVLGKSFTAVDISQTVKQPITPEQFGRIRRGSTQEIVYQLKNELVNIYTARENTGSLIFNSANHNLMQSKVAKFEQNSKKSQIRFVTQPNRPSPSNIYTQPKLNHQSYTFTIKPRQNTAIYIQQSRESRVFLGKHNNYQISEQLILQRKNSISSINKSMTSIKALRNDVKAPDEQFLDTKITKGNPTNLYEFKSSKGSDKATRLSNRSKSRDEYRYNLNSGDESENDGCQPACCHSNQLFASKDSYNPWK